MQIGKNLKLFCSTRFMVLTLTKIKADFDFELIVRRRWPCM